MVKVKAEIGKSIMGFKNQDLFALSTCMCLYFSMCTEVKVAGFVYLQGITEENVQKRKVHKNVKQLHGLDHHKATFFEGCIVH